MNLLRAIKRNLVNIPGWRTKKKILVIESDDWGSVSMPSMVVYNKLLAEGVPVDASFFAKYDCLESEDDLSSLFDVLSSFKDYKGNYPCITANSILANPDFERIRETDLTQYYYEPFTETYKKYPHHSKSFEIWEEGMKQHLLWPQFHGREHINPIEWLKCLGSGNKHEIMTFNHNTIPALINPIVSRRHLGYLAAFDYESIEELETFKTVIKEGCDLFENIFGFKSTSFVAPTSIRSDKIDPFLRENGVLFHQVGQQKLPVFEGYGKKDRYWGQTNKYGQTYWRRNGIFEPSSNWDFDWINKVLNDISIAFQWGKPAVINSHRVNYIGGIVQKNRTNTLSILKKLLTAVIIKYPDIEFMSSDRLGEEIISSRQS
jgi:hypothetical protein